MFHLLLENLLSPVVLIFYSRSAMSNPNGLLSQKVCHYIDQGRTLKDILLRTPH